MEEILHHLKCIKPNKIWDKLPINWCRISSCQPYHILLKFLKTPPQNIFLQPDYQQVHSSAMFSLSKQLEAVVI